MLLKPKKVTDIKKNTCSISIPGNIGLSQTANLPSKLNLCVGARVLLTGNISISERLSNGSIGAAKHLGQSFPYVHYCEFYKKLASRSLPVLFRLTYFSLIHTISSSAGKHKVIVPAVFLSKLDHISLCRDILCETILS